MFEKKNSYPKKFYFTCCLKSFLLHLMCWLFFVQIVCLLAFVTLIQCEGRDTLPSRLAVVFLGLLWRSVNKTSFLHVRQRSMLKLLPLVHVLGVVDNGHLYLVLTRSQNYFVLTINPLSSIGRVVSHVEASCSVLISFRLHCWPISLDHILTSFRWLYSWLSL